MSAELVDPFAHLGGATVSPLTPDELRALRVDIYAWDHDDRNCLPQLFAEALEYIGSRAVAGDPQAIQTLDVMATRSKSGIPFGEPQEPADSLDPEPRDRPYELVLDEDERRGD